MESCFYEGWVRHRRWAPVRHAFRYRVFQVYLDLDELPELFRGRWFWSAERPAPAWFRRADHLGDPTTPLRQAVGELIETETGSRPAGPIRLLTHLRYFGYVMNPVSFYYCYDWTGSRVETILAEVHNTPWGERHGYVLPGSQRLSPGRRLRFQLAKAFHVYPFMPMALEYDWRFSEPGRRLAVHMLTRREGRPLFDATLALARRPMTGATSARLLVRHPCMTGTVTGAIYWEALRLWWKGCPVYPHPRGTERGAGGLP